MVVPWHADKKLGENSLINTLKTQLQVLIDWSKAHPVLLVVFFVASIIASLIVCAVLITLLPPDYFTERRQVHRIKNPVLRIFLSCVKNLIGAILIVMGILLSLPGVPGQGILTILVGLIISDFPGKRRLEMRIINIKAVFSGANKIRARFNREPLVLEEKEDS